MSIDPGHGNESFSESRRRFLQTAAGATAATMLAAGMAKAATRRPVGEPKDEKPVPQAAGRVPLKEGDTIKVGVIGVGGNPGACAMGKGHCNALVSLNNKKRENVQ